MVRAWEVLSQTALRTDTYWLSRVSKWQADGLNLSFVPDGGHGSVLGYKGGRHIIDMYPDRLVFKYEGFGLDVVCHKDRTTTVIGLLGTQDPTRTTGTRYFLDLDMYKGSLPPNDNFGGLNILNIPGDEWSLTVNMQWLQNAMDRNDVIRIISDPLNDRTIWQNGIPLGRPGHNGRKTVTGKEIDYMVARGYIYDPYLPGYINN